MTSHSDYQLQLIVVRAWDRVVGPDTAAVTLVTAVVDRTVHVLTASERWVAKLEPRTHAIVERLNHAMLAPGAVTGIRWREGIPRPKESADASA